MCTTRAPVAVSQRSAEQVTALFNATLIVPQDLKRRPGQRQPELGTRPSCVPVAGSSCGMRDQRKVMTLPVMSQAASEAR